MICICYFPFILVVYLSIGYSFCQSICQCHFVCYSNFELEFNLQRDTQRVVELAAMNSQYRIFGADTQRVQRERCKGSKIRKKLELEKVFIKLMLSLLFNIIIFLNLKTLSYFLVT